MESREREEGLQDASLLCLGQTLPSCPDELTVCFPPVTPTTQLVSEPSRCDAVVLDRRFLVQCCFLRDFMC